MKNSLNGNAKILFLDSEGTSSTDKSTKTYDSRIFALVVLISSLFLYNTYSNIDEHGISELSLAAHLSNSITTNSEIDKDELLTELSPKFIWIIRDFTLEKVHPETGEEISSKEYLELCLKNKRCGKNSNDNNLIRQNIVKFFPERDCVTLVRPVDKESDLKKLNSIPFQSLKPDFKIEFKKLKDKIYKEALPKKYNGKRLNGPALALLIEEFVKTINSGKIPNINNSWDGIIEKDVNEYYNKAIFSFKSETAKLKNTTKEQETLVHIINDKAYQSEIIYNKLLQINCETFTHSGYRRLYDECKSKLSDQIAQIEKKILDNNQTMCNNLCNNEITACYQGLEKKLYSNTYNSRNIKDYSEDYINYLNEYEKKAMGNMKLKVLKDFTPKQEKVAIDYFINLMKKEVQKNCQKVSGNKKLADAELDDINNKRRLIEEKARIAAEKVKNLEKELKDQTEEVNDLNDQLKGKKEELAKLKEQQKVKYQPPKEEDDAIPGANNKAKKKKEKEDCLCGCTIY